MHGPLNVKCVRKMFRHGLKLLAKALTKHSHLNHSRFRWMDDIQRDTQLIRCQNVVCIECDAAQDRVK
jgi:hypothetical protein